MRILLKTARNILLFVIFYLVKPSATCKIVAVFALVALMLACYIEGVENW